MVPTLGYGRVFETSKDTLKLIGGDGTRHKQIMHAKNFSTRKKAINQSINQSSRSACLVAIDLSEHKHTDFHC